jgi:hypothetical protein
MPRLRSFRRGAAVTTEDCRWFYKSRAKATSRREEKNREDRGKNRARQREETQQNRERKYTEKQRKRKQRNPKKPT